MTCYSRRTFRMSIHSIDEITPSVLGNFDFTFGNLACSFLEDVQQDKEVPYTSVEDSKEAPSVVAPEFSQLFAPLPRQLGLVGAQVPHNQ